MQEEKEPEIEPADFSPLTGRSEPELDMGNLKLLKEVPMEVSVELGRTTKTISEILHLGEGSIIELDKLAGEPVDMRVNGSLLARGEVVVIDENFGIRITEVVKLKEGIPQE